MNKTALTELHRFFLIERLPEPLTPASSHLQIFDTYIPNTRIRVRQMREPNTNVWTRMLQQRFPCNEGEHAVTKLAEMHLDDDEFAVFERLQGNETRKNRYFHEFDRVSIAFDVYLGPLLGLSTARVDFDSREQMVDYEPAPFLRLEATEAPFFESQNLAAATFADVQAEVARLAAAIPVPLPDE